MTTATIAPTPIRIVLLPGPETRLLGASVRARNARVAARSSVLLTDLRDLAAELDPAEMVLLVPAQVVIDVSLFPLPTFASATMISSAGGGVALAGPWRDVSQHARLGRLPQTSAGFACASAGDHALLDASTSAGRRAASWSILRRTEKTTDGWVSRQLNRPVSRVLSYSLLSIGLSAWHASAMTLLVGLMGALIAAQPGYAAFVEMGLLFQLASILDGVDGEMARATLTESEFGALLDTIIDQVTYVAFFIGVTIGWAREGGSVVVLWWTVAVVLALVLSLLRGARFVSLHAPNASFVFIDRSVRRAAQDSGHMPLRAAASLFALLRRDAFAVIFLITSLTGRRAFVPFMVAFGVALANFTFSLYDRELAAAAARERLSS